MFTLRENLRRRIRLFSILLALLQAVLPFNNVGYAQTPDPYLQITGTDTRNFPTIQLDFKGKNLPANLPASSSRFTIIENGERVIPDSLETSYAGIHFSLAINPGYSLTLSGVSGQQYYAEMIKAIKTIGPDRDHPEANQYSLHINPDISKTELTNYDAWVKEIDAYQENQRNLVPSLDSLNLAITALENSQSNSTRFSFI